MDETLSSEQKIGRFKFLILQGYKLKIVADAKKKKINLISIFLASCIDRSYLNLVGV